MNGQSLRRLETAMQRLELSFLGTLPSGQRSLIAEGQPVVVGIVVTEVKDAEENNRRSKYERITGLHSSSNKLRICACRRKPILLLC